MHEFTNGLPANQAPRGQSSRPSSQEVASGTALSVQEPLACPPSAPAQESRAQDQACSQGSALPSTAQAAHCQLASCPLQGARTCLNPSSSPLLSHLPLGGGGVQPLRLGGRGRPPLSLRYKGKEANASPASCRVLSWRGDGAPQLALEKPQVPRVYEPLPPPPTPSRSPERRPSCAVPRGG